jgi:hypothetical protein
MKETTVDCPVSGKPMVPVFTETVLNKHPVTYYYSRESGLLKSEKPYWLEEAYCNAISDEDTGLVQRNIENRDLLEKILCCLSLQKGKFLDVGGGYGLLARLLLDKGFDCHTTDKYCQNLFAENFEPGPSSSYDVLFAFEVMEHIENPVDFISTAFHRYGCKTIIFSTKTFKDQVPGRDWWYYAFQTGQHITFYQVRTLVMLAEKLGCRYYGINSNYHIISDRNLSAFKRISLSNTLIRGLWAFFLKSKRKPWAKPLKTIR